MIRIQLEADGRLSLPVGIVNGLNNRQLTLTSRSRRHLLLATEEGCSGEVSLAGTIGELQVVEVLSFLNMFRKSGLLHFSLDGGSKELLFADGEIVAANSTFPEEELGEFLLSSGKIERHRLIPVRQAAANDPAALRSILLQNDLVSQKDLWEAFSAQVEAIVYHLLPSTHGHFVFIQRGKEAALPTHVVLSTQNLIMEGMRRADERKLYMGTLQSLEAMPLATGKHSVSLNADEERLLALAASGRLPIRDLLTRSGLDELKTLRILHRLVEGELLSLPDLQVPEAPAELAEILAIANGVLAALYQQIHEKNHDFATEIRRFLRDLPHPFAVVLRHVSLTSNGTIDGSRIYANLADYPASEQRALLAETMSELIFMACMAARRDLGDKDSQRLVQQAQEIAMRINQLKERK